MQVKRVQDYISKEWFDETDGSYFERLNSRLQVLLKKAIVEMSANNSELANIDYSVTSRETTIYATIIISTLPMLIIYPFIQKFFVKGVMIGAVKG